MPLTSSFVKAVVVDVYEWLILLDATYPGALRNVSTNTNGVMFDFVHVSNIAADGFRRLCDHLFEGFSSYKILPKYNPTHSRIAANSIDDAAVRCLRPVPDAYYEDTVDFSRIYFEQLEKLIRVGWHMETTYAAMWREFHRAAQRVHAKGGRITISLNDVLFPGEVNDDG